MKKLFLCTAFISFSLLGCRRDSPASKIIDGAPLGSTITVPPLTAVQGFHLLEKGILNVVVAITKRTATINPTYGDVTAIGGSQYQFILDDVHYGHATVVFTFRDGTNSIVDPISTVASTSTIQSLDINATSSGIQFNGSGNFTLTLAVLGDVNSALAMTGAFTMTGTTYTVTSTLPLPGATATFTGLTAGIVQFSGSGPGGPVGGLINVNTSHEYNGTLIWDGNNGEIHIKDNGQALLLLNNQRYFFQ